MYRILIYFAIFISPVGAQAFSMDLGGVQMSLFRISIILTLILLFISKARRGAKLRIYTAHNRYSVMFMLIWVLYAVITILWAKDISGWIRNLYFLIVAFLVILVFVNCFENKKHIVTAFKSLYWGITVQTLIGWYEVFTHDYRFVQMTDVNERYFLSGNRHVPVAMAGNSNDFATMMIIGVFLAYICLVTEHKKILKSVYLIGIVSDVILLLLTISRANIIGLIMAAIMVLAVNRKKKLMIIMGAILLITIFPQAITNLLSQLEFNLSLSNLTSGSDAIRLNLIKNGFDFLVKTFGFGVGCGQIEIWMRTESTYFIGNITNMHNWWAEILTAYGIVIFIGYLVFYLRLFSENYKKANQTELNSEGKAIPIAISAIMFGYIIAGISASSNITCEYLWVFWAICIANQGIYMNYHN